MLGGWVVFMLVAFVLFLVLACQPAARAYPKDGDINIWHDDSRGVTCWVYKDGYAGGISCLTDEEVDR